MWRILLVSIGLLTLMGCGSKRNQSAVVSGTITYKGQPVNGASLHLYPTSGGGVDPTIPVNQEGMFRISNIPPGEYKIVVEATQGGRMPTLPKNADPAKAAEMKQKLEAMQGMGKPTIPFPTKYKSIRSTDLKCTINQGEQTPLNLELKD